MTPSFEYRLANSAETLPIFELRQALARQTDLLLPAPEEVSETSTRSMLEHSTAWTFVALDGCHIVALCGMQRGGLQRNAHVARAWIGVLQQHWGFGIGRRLFETALAHATRNGIRRVELTVREDNLRALELYRGLGFEVEGRRCDALMLGGKFHDELWLSKRLLTP
ncbi:MAG: GNAT family N-acetyltransferase [Nannocystales bacterium]